MPRRARRIRIQPAVLEPCPNPTKQRYIDQPDAYRAARAIARKIVAARRHFEPLYGYRCPCGGWHTTRSPHSHAGVDNVLLYEIAEHLQAFALGGPAGS